SDVNSRRLAQIVDIRLKGQPHQRNGRGLSMLNGEVTNSMPHFLRAPECLVVIDFPGFANDLGLHREFSGNKVRVNRDAMASHTTTGLQDVHTRMLDRKSVV